VASKTRRRIFWKAQNVIFEGAGNVFSIPASLYPTSYPTSQLEVISIGKIHRLDEITINKIAAGEIVERPASVIKELVENSIDAGATRIEIEIQNGGRQLIKIVDNGCGMEREDAVLAIERHSTSKITVSDDLWSLNTLGFRGEALPSIAAVSRFEIITKTPGQPFGTHLEIDSGLLKKVKDIGAADGTTMIVHDLFYNTPARLKYLKTIPTETGYISEIVARLALGYPNISFRLQHHQYELLFTPGNGDLEETIIAVFGKEVAKEMIPVSDAVSNLKISGYCGKPSIARNNRNYEIFFVNRRFFHSRNLGAAVEKAYHTLLPIARYPFIILFLAINPDQIDVNVHPAKHEVKFSREIEIFKPVYHAVQNAIKQSSFIAEWGVSESGAAQQPPLPAYRPQTPTVAPASITFEYREFGNSHASSAWQEAAPVEVSPPTVPPSSGQPLSTMKQSNPEPSAPAASVTNEPEDSLFRVYPNAYRNTYIIVSDAKGLLIVDQHAAHERILYEKYLAQTKNVIATQALLIPLTFDLNYAQYKLVAERLTFFSEIGFELEAFGGKTIAVRSVPVSLLNYDYEQIILDLIEQYTNFKSFKNPAEIKESFLITMACRTAVKAGDSLKQAEMEQLIADLFKCDNPYTCPHGRPTIFRLSIEELTKKFLRR
jgi:DNA mismatch repair protein MutL